jgi:hypothetical protein
LALWKQKVVNFKIYISNIEVFEVFYPSVYLLLLCPQVTDDEGLVRILPFNSASCSAHTYVEFGN